MILEEFYNDVIIRLFFLTILSLILNHFYLKTLNNTYDKNFIRQEKSIYLLQLSFWLLYLSDFFHRVLPSNFIGSFFFELIISTILIMSFSFLIWRLFNTGKLSFGIFFISLPLFMVYLFVLGSV